jgi:hypothetical protein
MTEINYPEPVRQLMDIGYPGHNWPDYLAKYGFTREHIPDLIRLAEDTELRFGEPTMEEENFLNEEDGDLPRWYAQIHAWRALAQLKAEEAIPNLIGLLYQAEEYDDDWAGADLLEAFVKIGPVCIPALAAYLQDLSNASHPRNIAIEAVGDIVKAHSETREQGIAAIIPALQNHAQNDEGTNGFLIYALAKFKATEYLDLIKEVFDTDNVDLFIMGDFEDVQIEMGMLKDRVTPRAYRLVTERDMENARNELNKKLKKQDIKEKKKRKQEKKSRKKNRKRK